MKLEFVNYQGLVALAEEWQFDWLLPYKSRKLLVSNNEWDEWQYSQYTSIEFLGINLFLVSSSTWGDQRMSTVSWRETMEKVRIEAPGRGGKDWIWEWRDGRWQKTYGVARTTR